MNAENSLNADISQHPATFGPVRPTPAPACRTAALLIAHGSRRQAANDDLIRLAQLVRDREIYDDVEIAYLELAEPTIPQGIRQCVEQGSRRVLMLPYFLSAGEHAAGDLERFRGQAAQ
jgi:sirohydrochlorin ferrochelatase